MRMREDGTRTPHPSDSQKPGGSSQVGTEDPQPSWRADGDGGHEGNSCFLADLETCGRRREEGASELAPRELLAMCGGSVPRLSSHFLSETTTAPFPSAPAGPTPEPSGTARHAAVFPPPPPWARSCGWAVLSGDRPTGSRHLWRKANPKENKKAIKELPSDLYRLTGFIMFVPCPVSLLFFFFPVRETARAGCLIAALMRAAKLIT